MTTCAGNLAPLPGRVAIIVLGMHRSGTSAVTRALSLVGAGLPKRILGAGLGNEVGHWEPERLVYLHEEMLIEAGSRWDDWRVFDPSIFSHERLLHHRNAVQRLLEEEYGDASLIVLKDPRICRFSQFYEDILDELGFATRYVLQYRNPLAVIASHSKRDNLTSGFTSLLWLRHVLDSEIATRGKPRCFISYENFLENWKFELDRAAAELEVHWPQATKEALTEIEHHISPALQHHAPDASDLENDPEIADWVKRAYTALKTLTVQKDDADTLLALDEIRTEFNSTASIFGNAVFPEIAEREKRLTAASDLFEDLTKIQKAELASLQQELTSKTANLKNRTDKLKNVAASRDMIQGKLENSTQRLEMLNKELTKLQKKEKLLHCTIDEIHKSTSWRITKPLRAMIQLFTGQGLHDFQSENRSGSEECLARSSDSRQSELSVEGENTTVNNKTEFPEIRAAACADVPLVSVIIPVKNGMPQFKHVIDMVSRQQFEAEFEILVIDSGSSDGSKDIVPQEDARFRLLEVAPADFGHGKTRNFGIREAKGKFCAFLTHDATPANEFWLRELVKPMLEDERVAGVFGRHIAYRDATPFTRWELEKHFAGLQNWPTVWIEDAREYSRNEGLRKIFHFYSDNSSCLRKSVWERHPYPDVDFAEDQLWAKQIIEAGHRKAFAWDSVVYHSHDYSLWERVQRSYDESGAVNELFGYELCRSRKELMKQAFRTTARDARMALEHGWILSHPVATLKRPLDNLARQIGYYLGTQRSDFTKRHAATLSRDKQLQAR